MLRRYRLIILAALGLLSLANVPGQIGGAKRGSDQQQTSQLAAPNLSVAENAHQPAENCKGTSKPSLTCESISAQAAIDQARAADQQAAASWWGLGVGGLTLIVAVFAAVWAKNAANTAQDTFRAGRAWLCYSGVDRGFVNGGNIDGKDINKGFAFMPFAQNFGNSPAINIRASRDFALVGPADAVPAFKITSPPEHIRGATCPPGKPFSTNSIALDDEQTRRFMGRRIHVIIYIKIFYNDVFSDEEHITEVCLRIRHQGGQIGAGGEMVENLAIEPVGDQNKLS